MQILQVPPPPGVSVNPWEIAQAIVAIVGAIGGVAGGLMLIRALAKRIAGPRQEPALESAELHELRDQVQHLTGRVGELDERVDFAERLLARDRDAERLKGPKA